MKKSILAIALLSVVPLAAMNSSSTQSSAPLETEENKGMWGKVADKILDKNFGKFEKLFNENKDNLTEADFEACITKFSAYASKDQMQTKIVERFKKFHDLFIEKGYGQTAQKEDLLSNFQNNLGVSYKKIADRSEDAKSQNYDTALSFFEHAQKTTPSSPHQDHMEILHAKQKEYLDAKKYREAAYLFKKEAEISDRKFYFSFVNNLLEGIHQSKYNTTQKELDDIEGALNALLENNPDEEGKKNISAYFCNLANTYRQTLSRIFSTNQKFCIEKIFSSYEKAIKLQNPEAPINYIYALNELDLENQKKNQFKKMNDLLGLAISWGYGEYEGETEQINQISGIIALHLTALEQETLKLWCDDGEGKGHNETIPQTLAPKKEENKAPQIPSTETFLPQPSKPLPEETKADEKSQKKKSPEKQKAHPTVQDFLKQAQNEKGLKNAMKAYEEGLQLFPDAIEIYQGIIQTYHSFKGKLKQESVGKMQSFCKEVLGKPFVTDVMRAQTLECLVFSCQGQNKDLEVLEILKAENLDTLTHSLLLSLYQSQKALGKQESRETLDQVFKTAKDCVSVNLYLDWIEGKINTVQDVDTFLIPLDSKERFIKIDNFQVDLEGFGGKTFWSNLIKESLENGKDFIVSKCCEKVDGLFLIGEFLKLKQEKNVTQLPYKSYQKHSSSSLLKDDFTLNEFHSQYLMRQGYLNFEVGFKEDALSFGEKGIKELSGKCAKKFLKPLVEIYLEKAQENDEPSQWIQKVGNLKPKAEDPEWIEDKLTIFELKLSSKQKEKKDAELKAQMEKALAEKDAEIEKLKNHNQQQSKVLLTQHTRDMAAKRRIAELEVCIDELKGTMEAREDYIAELEEQLSFLRAGISDTINILKNTPEDGEREKAENDISNDRD